MFPKRFAAFSFVFEAVDAKFGRVFHRVYTTPSWALRKLLRNAEMTWGQPSGLLGNVVNAFLNIFCRQKRLFFLTSCLQRRTHAIRIQLVSFSNLLLHKICMPEILLNIFFCLPSPQHTRGKKENNLSHKMETELLLYCPKAYAKGPEKSFTCTTRMNKNILNFPLY